MNFTATKGPYSVLDSRNAAAKKLKFEPTLWQVFVICLIGLTIHFAALGWVLFSGLMGRIDSPHAVALLLATMVVTGIATVGWVMPGIMRQIVQLY